MANTTSSRLDAVVEFIVANHNHLEFFQMARLLAYALSNNDEQQTEAEDIVSGNWEDHFNDYLRIRPMLSMSFPGTDISNAEVLAENKLRVETTFFGLYGVTSPLPNFYTEGLIAANQNGNSNARGLIDIFHYAAYPLLMKAWTRYRGETGLRKGVSKRQLTRKASWIGLVGDGARKRFDQWPKMLQLAPLFANSNRSASGLQALVTCIVGSGIVRIRPCAPTRVTVPKKFKCRLGQSSHQLGTQVVLGNALVDHLSHVEIVISEQLQEDLEDIVPGGKRYRLLEQSIQLFSHDNLRIRLKAIHESWPLKLGASKLGLGASLGNKPRVGWFNFYIN